MFQKGNFLKNEKDLKNKNEDLLEKIKIYKNKEIE